VLIITGDVVVVVVAVVDASGLVYPTWTDGARHGQGTPFESVRLCVFAMQQNSR